MKYGLKKAWVYTLGRVWDIAMPYSLVKGQRMRDPAIS